MRPHFARLAAQFFSAFDSSRPLIFASLAVLTACSTDSPTAVSPLNVSAARSNTSDASGSEPWKGHCTTNVAFLSQTELLITGDCELAHLGHSTFVNHQVIAYGPVITYSSAITYTAANGDELRTTDVGTATPNGDGSAVTLAGTETVIGGSGRFANAAGSAALAGTAYLAGERANTGFYDLLGTLTLTRAENGK